MKTNGCLCVDRVLEEKGSKVIILVAKRILEDRM